MLCSALSLFVYISVSPTRCDFVVSYPGVVNLSAQNWALSYFAKTSISDA